MFPLLHDLHTLAQHHQQSLLAEAAHAHLVRQAMSGTRVVSRGASWATLRRTVAASLYVLAGWMRELAAFVDGELAGGLGGRASAASEAPRV